MRDPLPKNKSAQRAKIVVKSIRMDGREVPATISLREIPIIILSLQYVIEALYAKWYC